MIHAPTTWSCVTRSEISDRCELRLTKKAAPGGRFFLRTIHARRAVRCGQSKSGFSTRVASSSVATGRGPCMDRFLCMALAQLTFRESFARHRGVLALAGQAPLSHGYRGQVSRNTRMPTRRVIGAFMRIFSTSDRHCPRSVYRALRSGTCEHGLCTGFHDDRFVIVAVVLGTIRSTTAAVKLRTPLDL